MKQSRAASLFESLVNVGFGFGLSMLLQATVLPALGVPMPLAVNLAFAVLMTAVSIARSYLLRRLFEALRLSRPLSPFMQAVIAERFRQIDVEGWSAEHDDNHRPGEIAIAGAAYLLFAPWHLLTEEEREHYGFLKLALQLWPWSHQWWKPQGFRRDLVRGCALAIAEGEKFDRLKTARSRGLPGALEKFDAYKAERGVHA